MGESLNEKYLFNSFFDFLKKLIRKYARNIIKYLVYFKYSNGSAEEVTD